MGPSAIFRFGVFELDLSKAELRKSGVRVRLHDQPFRILTVLLERAGQVVTREELRNVLWPDETFVDFDHGMNSAVNKLRETLADSASNPRYVETVPRRGYRFIAPVESVQQAAAHPEIEGADSRKQPAGPVLTARIKWPLLVAGLAAAAIASVAVYTRSSFISPKVSPLTSDPGRESLPSLSPDGRQVAFVWNGEHQNNYDIYVKLLGTERALRLTNQPAMETNPVWSPDAASIAFLRVQLPETLDVMLISPLGGAERKVGEIRHPGMVDAHTRPAAADTHKRHRISWTPNGEWLVVRETPNEKEASALFLLSVRTGEKRRLTSPPLESGGDRDPAVSPDGSRIAFVRGPPGIGSQIHVLELDANLAPKSDPLRLTSSKWSCHDPAWTSDSLVIIFSAGSVHSPSLWRMRASGSEPPRQIHEAGYLAYQPAIAGSRLVYSRFILDVNIWKFEASPLHGKKGQATKFNASTHVDHMPDFSPGGERVAFISTRTGSQEIWAVNADGSNPVRLTFLVDREALGLRWSPDGKRILFQVNNGEEAEALTIGGQGGPAQTVVNSRGAMAPNWSRDGRWIYFSRRQGSEFQTWRVPAQPADNQAPEIPVMKANGQHAMESPDGKFLYYVKQNALWRTPLPDGAEQRVLPSLSYPMNYAVVNGGIYFIPEAREGERDTLRFLHLATQTVRVVHTLDKQVTHGLAASPDGRSVLYTQLDHYDSDLMVVENFR
ncbi:MAG: winged helix-turn-helix domain-containing protein [Bryobacteraceae bacterium]